MLSTLRRALTVVGVVSAALVLAACTGAGPVAPSPSGPPVDSPQAEPSASESSPAPAPTLMPGGTADDNLAYFNSVNSAFLSPAWNPGGRSIIDNLVAAGFDKAAMQVTADTTTLGRDVDSMQFSVLMGDRCLLGQTSAAGYTGAVGPAVDGSRCLIGNTRTIDW